MHKAIRLKIILRLAGECEPTLDFAALAALAAHEAIGAGFKDHPELKAVILEIAEYRGDDDDDDEPVNVNQ